VWPSIGSPCPFSVSVKPAFGRVVTAKIVVGLSYKSCSVRRRSSGALEVTCLFHMSVEGSRFRWTETSFFILATALGGY
jgi:hypothetical protein